MLGQEADTLVAAQVFSVKALPVIRPSEEVSLPALSAAPSQVADVLRRFTGVLLEKRIRLTARIVPGGRHCEASWEKQIPFFLPTLLYGSEE